MASFNKAKAGFVPQVVKKRRKPKSTHQKSCVACGFTGGVATSRMKTTSKLKRIDDDDYDTHEYYCGGCLDYFEIETYFTRGTLIDYREEQGKLEKLKELKYCMVNKTQTFSSVTSGNKLGIEFGDIFRVTRNGLDTVPTGNRKSSMAHFSLDISVGGEVLTLFPYEVIPIPWVEIMLLKKEGSYIEGYLNTEDTEGVFYPVPEYRKELIRIFGDR